MIKNFNQFNEELSPQLLRRASNAAHGATNSQGVLNPQTSRAEKFNKYAGDIERKEKDSKKKKNYNEFMALTGGKLFGYECVVDTLRVNPGGDTWIEIICGPDSGGFETKKIITDTRGNQFNLIGTRIIIRDEYILNAAISADFKSGSSLKLSIIGTKNDEHYIDLNELVFENRKYAKDYAKFLNWWNGAALGDLDKIPFSVNDYKVKGLH